MEKAKLKTGDVILKFDGKDVDEMKALPRIVAETPIDKDVTVEFWRDGKKRKTRANIGELEKAEENGLLSNDEDENEEEPEVEESEEIEEIGLSVSEISDETREAYNIEDSLDGVLITDVDRKSQAAKEGIIEGDVIVEMNQQEVNDADDIKKQIRKAQKAKRSSVLLLINREGNVRFIALKLKDEE